MTKHEFNRAFKKACNEKNLNLLEFCTAKEILKDIFELFKHLEAEKFSEILNQPYQNNIPCNEIIDYLNNKCGAKFSLHSQLTRKLIQARWNEGHRLEDFITVIDNKHFTWSKEPKMLPHLKPITLFGNKFEQYLNELNSKKALEKTLGEFLTEE
jgi:uncharacterized phage protein (TIGR02220 family)